MIGARVQIRTGSETVRLLLLLVHRRRGGVKMRRVLNTYRLKPSN